MKSTEDLARACNVPEWRLKAQLKAVNDRRTQLRLNGLNGRTIQKRDSFYATSQIPKWVWLHPEFKETYFANDQDQETRNKNLRLFLKKYPEWDLGGKA